MVDLAARRATAVIANTVTIKGHGVVSSRKVQLAVFANIGCAKIKAIQVCIRPCGLYIGTACGICQAKGPGFNGAGAGFTIAQFRTVKDQRIVAIGHVQGIGAFTADERIVRNIFPANIGNIACAIDIRATGMFGGITGFCGAISFEVQNVVAVATIKGVVARTARKNVAIVTTTKLIVTITTRKGVAARTAIDVVIA